MALNYIDQADLSGKVVIARFDFNVPLNKEDRSEITDTTRIDNALETINYILSNGAKKLILMSHLGRPKGERNMDFTLEPVATYLASKLGEDVILSESCTDRGIKTLLGLNESKVILLENLRFHAEETSNDRDFAKTLANYADIYVNDAFGAAHRKHASTYGINEFFKNKAYAGFLIKNELQALEKVVGNAQKPFVAIVGGAKVSDKIKIIEKLLRSVDSLLIGGAMAYPFLKAKGLNVGKSLCTDEDVSLAKRILNDKTSHKTMLPVDHITSKDFGGMPELVNQEEIPEDFMGLDIGPRTRELYEAKIKEAKTVLWNGPMGLFENKDFAEGSFSIAKALAESDAFTLIGGGDSVSAVNQSGLSSKMSHISTGGGASLEYIENGSLPGIQALKFGVN
ncbi:MAG: phosphoglycerate kinase [Bdellovibrionota bacterium]|nr:phosphoglycerate kinase [Bdellovibrionota bacterium]